MPPRRKCANIQNTKLNKKLISIIKAGDVDEVKKFIYFHRHGFVNKLYGRKYSLLRLALENRQPDVASYLLKSDCSVNTTATRPCKTALYFAVANADFRTVAKLLKRGAKTDARLYLGINSHLTGGDLSVLHVAVNAKLAKIVFCLLKFGANVHTKCESLSLGPDCTPLHLAAETGSELIAWYLLRKGALANVKNGQDMTPLHIAVMMNNVGVVLELLRYGAGINIRNCNDGYTSLHYSAVYGQQEITEILLQRGGNINSSAECNRTPLQIALHYGNVEVSELIVKCIAKMKAEGTHVNSVNDSAISLNCEPFFYNKNCKAELFRMKHSAINETISFLDVLIAKGNQTVIYARNDKVRRVVDKAQYRKIFPIYGSLVERQIAEGEFRNDWIQENISFFKLPYYCVEMISSYLSNTDLENFTSAQRFVCS